MKSKFRTWSDVRTFLTVYREGSTLAASRKLGQAQPTVARRIEVLENEIGLVLFERDTRGFKPTQAACDLYPLAEAMEDAALSFEKQANGLAQSRPIRITAYSGNFSPRINKIFSDFSIQNPGASFEFLPSVKVLDLEAGEADIALRVTRKEPNGNLICRKISTAQYSLYGAKNYAEKRRLPDSPDNLHDHLFVTFERDDVPPYLHNWLKSRVSPKQIIMSFSEIELMHSAIKSGHGLGLMNVRLAEMDEAFIRCFEIIEELSASHLMLIAPEAYRRPEVKAFVKFFAPRYASVFR